MRMLPPLVALLFSGLSLHAQEPRYFPQIGDGALDGLQVQTSLILVNTGPQAEVNIEFLDSQGQPLFLTVNEVSASQRQIELAGGAGLTLQTSGLGNAQEPLAVGYARLEAPESVEASAVFTIREQETGILLVEAAVAAVRPLQDFSIFFDSSGSLDTGLAMVSAGEGGLLTLTLRDSQSQVLAQSEVEIASGQRIAAFVTELLQDTDIAGLEEMRGSVTVQSQAGPIAALTLRQIAGVRFPQAVPALTTFPVAPPIVSSQTPSR